MTFFQWAFLEICFWPGFCEYTLNSLFIACTLVAVMNIINLPYLTSYSEKYNFLSFFFVKQT